MAIGKKTGGRDFEKGNTVKLPAPRKGTGIPQDIREAARQYTIVALETLVWAMKQKKSPPTALAAATAILDRAYGRPAQTTEITGPDGKALLDSVITVKFELPSREEPMKIVDGHNGHHPAET